MVTLTASASSKGDDTRIAEVKALKFDFGNITSVKYDSSEALTINDNTLDNLAPRTVVKIVLSPAKGSKSNVEIWLPEPDKWNKRLLGIGNGGAAGSIHPGCFAWAHKAGYAVVTTDMGTAPNAESGIGNPEVWKDFGYRATHLMTVVAKDVVKAYYGEKAKYAYFFGGSTGGQQGLQEAQRYPDDYDGIVANVPAHCRTPLHAYFLWNEQIFHKCPFSESQEANVIAAGIEYMASREVPATAGKLVSDPRCNAEDIEAVITLARKKDPTLTEEHAKALRKLFEGPRHEVSGEHIFDGIPFGSSLSSAHGHLYIFKWAFGADVNLQTINFGKDIDTYTATLAPYLTAENPDLRKFNNNGGKLIMISGTADSVVPYHATLDYYERTIDTFGSLDNVQDFFRFYIIPGMAHGLGGSPGINRLPSFLDLLVEWRENGTAPNEIRGQRVVEDKTLIDIPIYPYPQKTGYDAAKGFYPVTGPRGGVGRVASSFRPNGGDVD